MTSQTLAQRAEKAQQRAERAVAYWIDRLAEDGVSFVGSEHQERFEPLSLMLAELLQRALHGGESDDDLRKAEQVVDQLEAYSLGAEGMRVRARWAHEDIMARREELGVPLAEFQRKFEALLTALHQIDVGGAQDTGRALLEARRMLLDLEQTATRG